LPIDDSDGGCETAERSSRAWTRQIATIQIEPGDAITDSNEALALMQQRGIDHVVIMGVHTNMCVLGRPFGIRQLVKQGKNVVLVRDLTDTMYNPARRPFVSHFTGTDLVVEHIEKYWCPSVTSVDFLGGREFRFKEDRRPHLVFISAESEYFTERTLPEFALQQLGRHFRVSAVYADPKDYHTLPGLQVLKEADVVLFSLRRRPLVKEQMDLVRKCIAAGKGVAGVRTASHAFAKRAGEKLRPDVIEWPDFDREVLGCYYKGHHPNVLKPIVQAAPGAAEHPILTGIKAAKFTSAGSLYRSLPLAEDATLLMIGLAGELKPEPVAWCRRLREGSRVFCTSLGHQDDFREPIFQILLRNGILWAAGVPIPAADAPGN
jgi:type 1 glutamine amidotransferase